MEDQKALLATTNLTGLVELANSLTAKGWQLTCWMYMVKSLADAGVEIASISSLSDGANYDLVVCDLPNFQTVLSQEPMAFEEARQRIDLDRMATILAAIYKYPQTLVLVSPTDYQKALECLDLGEMDGTHFRRDMAAKAAALIVKQVGSIEAYFAMRRDVLPRSQVELRLGVGFDKKP